MATPQGRRGARTQKPEKGKLVLRMARASDASYIWHLLKHYFDESLPFYPPPLEMPTIAWGLTVIARGAVVVAIRDGKMIGCMGLERGAHPWNPSAQYFNAVWFYVIPEERKGGVANHLVKAAKAIAAENQIPLRMDYVWGVNPEKQDRYREIMGLTYAGGNYLWVPPKTASEGQK